MEQNELFEQTMILYEAAIVEITSGLEIAQKAFKKQLGRDCIETIKSRVKRIESIKGKLEKKGLPVTAESAIENLKDIAGVRGICAYIDDVYLTAKIMRERRNIQVLEEKDYIKNPKPNGYRSYHMIFNVPIFGQGKVYNVKAELQLRTIAMDCWASLEHQMKYKKNIKSAELIAQELKSCADDIASVDINLQTIRDMINENCTL